MNEHAVLATWTLELIGPELRFTGGVPPARFGAAMVGGSLSEAEENISDVLPEGYYIKIREWDEEETPNERS